MHGLKSPNGIMFSYFDEGGSMLLGGHRGPLLVGGLMGGRVAWGWGLGNVGGGAAYSGSRDV